MKRLTSTLLGCAITIATLIVTGFCTLGVSGVCGATLAVHAPVLLLGIFTAFFGGGYVTGFCQVRSETTAWTALITSPGIWCSMLFFLLPDFPVVALVVPISISWGGCGLGMHMKRKKVEQDNRETREKTGENE